MCEESEREGNEGSNNPTDSLPWCNPLAEDRAMPSAQRIFRTTPHSFLHGTLAACTEWTRTGRRQVGSVGLLKMERGRG